MPPNVLSAFDARISSGACFLFGNHSPVGVNEVKGALDEDGRGFNLIPELL
jgi:hypothetical protein